MKKSDTREMMHRFKANSHHYLTTTKRVNYSYNIAKDKALVYLIKGNLEKTIKWLCRTNKLQEHENFDNYLEKDSYCTPYKIPGSCFINFTTPVSRVVYPIGGPAYTQELHRKHLCESYYFNHIDTDLKSRNSI